MRNNVIQVDFKKLKTRAETMGLATPVIAERAEITPAAVYNIFQGKVKNPGVVTLTKICNVIGLELGDVLIQTKRKAA